MAQATGSAASPPPQLTAVRKMCSTAEGILPDQPRRDPVAHQRRRALPRAVTR